jgi:hypothetical protein
VPNAVFSAVGSPIIRNGNVAFSSQQFSTPTNNIVPGQGIYRASATAANHPLTKIVDTNTPRPGGGTFGDRIQTLSDQLQLLDFDGQNAIFSVSHDNAIYTDLGGTIQPVANQNTLIPGTNVPLAAFDVAAIDHGRIVFSATPQIITAETPSKAIYAWDNGVLTRILAVGDVIDGKTVAGYNFDANSLDGDAFAVKLGFNDGAAGIYQTVVPEPGIGMAVLAGGILMQRRRPRPIE